jgi:preprotein translocase subunit YajC
MQPAQPSTLEMLFPFAIVLVVMYFMMIRPQTKRAKEHDTFLKGLKRGDQVITSSGMLGTIDGMTDQFVTLEIASGVKVKMLRKQIASSATAITAAATSSGSATTETKKA